MVKKSEAGDESKLLTLDYNNVTAEVVGADKGLGRTELEAMKRHLTYAQKSFLRRKAKGLYPFADLPFDAKMASLCRRLATEGRKKYDDAVVLGIGGSALGANAVFSALRPLNHNSLPDETRGWPRLRVADNIDPESFEVLLDGLDLKKTFFYVISKSGATAETMSQFMIVTEKLEKKLGRKSVKDHVLFVTDPEKGVLNKLMASSPYDFSDSLSIPPGVGGRFSVFTAVGLAPLAMVGVDVAKLLAGARAAQEDFEKPVMSNKALLFAGLNHQLRSFKNGSSLVMMPYADSLARVSDWFGQLWNESLGKAERADGGPPAGQTAIKAVGATDQHSQLQLYMEGPEDKIVCFLGVEKYRANVKIPRLFQDQPELAYLSGRGLGDLLNFERQGTARALAENRRPNMTLLCSVVSPQTVGYLLQTLMLATIVSGSLYGVDPLDQPGVELGKKFTYGLMGREGFEEMKARYDKGLKSDPRRLV
ncbi:MAG: glucose-6-phosphate isomerase [Deltaproteobacteria bacterium]|jgi:glucose-6-phosphate isomerase|nr:glucose-6-phosphate isomerase [Deltaproteobacteria bacterium]